MSKYKHLKEITKLKSEHLNEKMDLIRQMGDKAVDKAFDSMTQHNEVANGKFELLKEQATKFPTKADLKAVEDKVALIYKFMWMTIGAITVIQVVVMLFFKK